MDRLISAKLEQWKMNFRRKPLILEGARQVGKTYIVEDFARHHFENYAYLNLEHSIDLARAFDQSFDPEVLIREFSLRLPQAIDPARTLIFIDEVQASERPLPL